MDALIPLLGVVIGGAMGMIASRGEAKRLNRRTWLERRYEGIYELFSLVEGIRDANRRTLGRAAIQNLKLEPSLASAGGQARKLQFARIRFLLHVHAPSLQHYLETLEQLRDEIAPLAFSLEPSSIDFELLGEASVRLDAACSDFQSAMGSELRELAPSSTQRFTFRKTE